MMETVFILLVILCFLLSFMVSGFYFALQSVPDSRFAERDKEKAEKENTEGPDSTAAEQKTGQRTAGKTRGILYYHDHSEKSRRIFLLAVILNGILSELFLLLFMHRQEENLPGLAEEIIAGILVFVLYLTISVYLPYFIFSVRNEKGLQSFYGVFRFCHILMTPVFLLTDRLARVLSLPFVGKNHPNPDEVTEEEILTMVNEGNESGSILPSEAEMVQNVFELDDKCVKDIMVHRSEIDAMDGNISLSDAIRKFQEDQYSRFPVYLESLDNIIGIVHIKDILSYALKPDQYKTRIRDLDGLLHPAETVPETHGIYTLFTTMQLQKTHMAVVVDEYGQTSGLVSMEDILEEIVGNIQDEHDDERNKIREVQENEFRMDGSTPLEEVGELLKISFEDEDVETLNGFLMNEIGRVPEDGETFTVHARGYVFHVLRVQNRMIREVLVTPDS